MKGLAPETVVKLLLLLLAIIVLFLVFPKLLNIVLSGVFAVVKLVGCVVTGGAFC